MPEAHGEATVKGKVKCPHCRRTFETELTDEVSVEFELSDYAPEWDEP